MVKVLVSACLMGERVRYDGSQVPYDSAILRSWKHNGIIVPFCPEVAGNLPVPRPSAEIIKGTGTDVIEKNTGVFNINGKDVTESFIRGAEKALAVARKMQITIALLKDGSPSCGKTSIYDGSFSKVRRPGNGVTMALLEKNGISVFSEYEIKKAAAYLETIRA
ncbi:MAG: DUF523 domain-containing protein [Deltaproteobacteria bacterium]|nr:DUF523 domain-containing protein [Deltaproteobacteria bacterium]